MAAYTMSKIFYISVEFWFILGVESYDGWSNHTLTVNTGGSVTIPCYYDKKYTQQKKYWFSEIDESIKYTNTTEENLSVIDHPDQSLFTVTMTNLQNTHTGKYYCVVETGEQPPIKTIYEPYLMIQSAPDVFVVNSSVSGHEGGDISNKLKQTDTSQISSVQISDDDGSGSFTVLMTGLRLTDSGWYYCSAEEAINPVHITVTGEEPHKEKDTSMYWSICLNVFTLFHFYCIFY
uniref:Si:dkeyp-104b3.18 n=1 Tax=Cyprinus carpio TaxID=7962 RepID=A0A8C2HK87_CYPCA